MGHEAAGAASAEDPFSLPMNKMAQLREDCKRYWRGEEVSGVRGRLDEYGLRRGLPNHGEQTLAHLDRWRIAKRNPWH